MNFTSIDSENLNDADCLELYPNPVTDSFELACFPENGRVIVYDNNGKQLISSNHKTVNCTSLSDGTYLARVLTDKGRVIATIQFIVSKNR